MPLVRLAARALPLAAAALFASISARAADHCGRVCVYGEPKHEGNQVCFTEPVEIVDLEKTWGPNFTPRSIKVTRADKCEPIAYFFSKRQHHGVVHAFFGSVAKIPDKGYKSFRVTHKKIY